MDWIVQTLQEAGNRLMGLELYQNGVLSWGLAGMIAVLAFLVLLTIRQVLSNRIFAVARIAKAEPLSFFGDLIKATHPLVLMTLSVFIASQALDLPNGLQNLVRALPILSVLIQMAFWGNSMIEFLLDRYVDSRDSEQDRLMMKTMLGPVKFILLLGFWSILLLMGLSNLGINITALVAGLGVGGIAIALAVQNILGDLFASMSIVIDKPFVIGDFIIVDDFLGTVEYIGLKTTRVRGLGGEQLIFSNSDLLSSRIRNFKRMSERRAVFGFRVILQTPADKVATIPGIVREIIGDIETARFDRAHFKGFGESSLEFEVVYYVLSPDYNAYMDIQQTINLALMRRLGAMDVEFAYPARTLFVANETPAFQVRQMEEVRKEALRAKAN